MSAVRDAPIPVSARAGGERCAASYSAVDVRPQGKPRACQAPVRDRSAAQSQRSDPCRFGASRSAVNLDGSILARGLGARVR
jgi:hypothetical protein